MLIVACDPGGTTGVASNINGFYETFTQPERKELYTFLYDLPSGVIVLCEKFITSNIHSHKWGIFTTEIVGGIEAICYIRKLELHMRTNHQRIPFKPRAKQILDSKNRSYQEHELDALAHIIGWERYNEARTRPLET